MIYIYTEYTENRRTPLVPIVCYALHYAPRYDLGVNLARRASLCKYCTGPRRQFAMASSIVTPAFVWSASMISKLKPCTFQKRKFRPKKEKSAPYRNYEIFDYHHQIGIKF